MKRTDKIFLSVIGGIFVFGIILCIAGFAMDKTAFLQKIVSGRISDIIGEVIDDSSEGVIDETTFADITSLKVSVDAGNVKLIKGSGSDIVIPSTNDPGTSVKVKKSGSQLDIDVDFNSKTIFQKKGATVTIEIPETTFEFIELDADAGRIEADILYANKIKLSSDAAEIKVTDLQAGTLEADADAANIDITGLASNNDLRCNAGNITYDILAKQDEFDYELDSDIGNIAYGNKTLSTFFGKDRSISGKSRSIKADCNVGNINIDFLQ